MRELKRPADFDGLKRLPDTGFKPAPFEPRYATIEGEESKVSLEHKASVRHLGGQKITVEQAQAIASAPDETYLFIANRLIDAIKYGLLPPKDKHPALWDELRELSKAIAQLNCPAP
jgi:hypothetical protein